jgi:hypothetical protein
MPGESPPLVIMAMRRFRPSRGGGGAGAIVECIFDIWISEYEEQEIDGDAGQK